MKNKNKPQKKRLAPLSNREILARAYVSDDIGKAFPDGIPGELGSRISIEALRGNRVVLVYWTTGECAVMPCPPGTDMPSPLSIVTAYHGCQHRAKTSCKGGFA